MESTCGRSSSPVAPWRSTGPRIGVAPAPEYQIDLRPFLSAAKALSAAMHAASPRRTTAGRRRDDQMPNGGICTGVSSRRDSIHAPMSSLRSASCLRGVASGRSRN